MPKSKSQDYTQVVTDDGEGSRSIGFHDPNWKAGDSFVNVTQEVDYKTKTYKPAMVSWVAIGKVDVDEARHFQNAVDRAVAIARLWNEKIGKKPDGVNRDDPPRRN